MREGFRVATMETTFTDLYISTVRLMPVGLRLTDRQYFDYRDQLRALKNRFADTMNTDQEAALAYSERFLTNANDLINAVKEMRTQLGNDKDCINSQRKLLDWFEKQGAVIERKFRSVLDDL